jgi:hypothetical protein
MNLRLANVGTKLSSRQQKSLLLVVLYKNLASGANPTIASYNASVVQIYSAVNSMARF